MSVGRPVRATITLYPIGRLVRTTITLYPVVITGVHHIYCMYFRMDSFVLAETFKYLYLMYAEEEEIVLPINEFVFTTEAHLIPLNISTLNISDNGVDDGSIAQDDDTVYDNASEEVDDILEEIMVPLKCDKVETERWSDDYYRRLMLRQCGSLRYGLVQSGYSRREKHSVSEWRRSVTTGILDFSNPLHIKELNEMGISFKSVGNGQIQLFQSPKNVCPCVCMCVCALGLGDSMIVIHCCDGWSTIVMMIVLFYYGDSSRHDI